MYSCAVENPSDIAKQLRWHRRFDGIFFRVAQKLDLEPSYVSRVVNGQRSSNKVMEAVIKEIDRLNRIKPK